MVATKELVLTYTVLVTPKNLDLVKRLAKSTMIVEDEDEIEVGEEIDVDFELEGEFSDYALQMAMLFNTSLAKKPFIRIIRDSEVKTDEVFKPF